MYKQIDGQITIADLFKPIEVDIRGFMHDGYCPNCNACLEDLIKQCPYCRTYLSWDRWKRINIGG